MPRVRDIVIVPTDARFTNLPDWDTHPPASWDNGPVALGDGITIECLSGEDAKAVMDASTPAGENFEATRQFSQLYAFVREIGDAEYQNPHSGWDMTHALTYTLALSRLVLDNAYCTEFAARLIEEPDGRRIIEPVLGLDQRLAYRLRETRFWLTETEAAELATLRDAFSRNEGLLPDRVRRAIWRCGRSAETRFLGETVMHVVTGLEALLKTERHNATNQFTTRMPMLAAALVPGGSATDWRAVYAARSDVSHGAEVALFAAPGRTRGGTPPPAAIALVAATQDLLRAAVRRAIEDAAFRAQFADDGAVRAAWPI